jgi:hypothetical protein
LKYRADDDAAFLLVIAQQAGHKFCCNELHVELFRQILLACLYEKNCQWNMIPVSSIESHFTLSPYQSTIFLELAHHSKSVST